jgi:hypothetical protein
MGKNRQSIGYKKGYWGFFWEERMFEFRNKLSRFDKDGSIFIEIQSIS